jgi:hypothetical protein
MLTTQTPETIVMPFIPDFLSTYLSCTPLPNDAVLNFGPIDQLLTPSPFYLPTRLYSTFPHPMQGVLPLGQGGSKFSRLVLLYPITLPFLAPVRGR